MANYMSRGRYGNPRAKDYFSKNLVTVKAPNGVPFTVHREAAPAFQGFVNELAASGYQIRPADSGGYNLRTMRGGTALSQHAFGNAIDINWSTNPMQRKLQTDMPDNITEMAAKWGLEWGGNWRGKKDAMHFEWTGAPVLAGVGALRNEADIKAVQTALAEQGLYTGEIDGQVGPMTRKALASYAESSGIMAPAVPETAVAQTDKGDPAVSQLQTYLAQNGFDPGPVNGVMSEQTMTALNSYNAKADPEGDALARVMLAEARGEGPEGMAAVAWVARNRTMDQSGLWPKDIAGVVSQKGQFAPPLDKVDPQVYAEAFRIASQVRRAPPEQDPTQGATYFKTGAVNPRWASVEPFKGQIGNHQFYGQVQTEAPTPQATAALALDSMATETAPAQQAAAEMAAGTGVDTLAGGITPPTPRIRDQAVLNQALADQLDEAIFGAGPHRGEARTRPETFEYRGGGAPDASEVPDPVSRLASGVTPPPPQTDAMPNPRPRASGLPDPRMRPDINDPSLSFNAPEYAGGGPTSGPVPEALADQLDTMVAGREEFPGALPAASREGDLSAAMGNAPPRPSLSPPTPEITADFIDSLGLAEDMNRAREDTEFWTGNLRPQAEPPPAPFGRTPEVGNLNYADTPAGRLPQTQAAVTDMGSGAGPYGTGMPASLAFDQARMDDGLKAPISIPETYADLLDVPEGMNDAAFGRSYYPGLLPLEREVISGASPDQLSLDAMPGSDASRFFNANPPTTSTMDRVMAILDEGREPTVSLAGGPRETSPLWSQSGSGQWMTDATGNEIISRAHDWPEAGPSDLLGYLPQGDGIITDADQVPSTVNAANLAKADVLDAGDVGTATAANAVQSATTPRYDPLASAPQTSVIYEPNGTVRLAPWANQGMVINQYGAQTAAGANRPVFAGGSPTAAATSGEGSAPVVVDAPQLGGGRLNGTSGGLFGMGANWAGPQWAPGATITQGSGPYTFGNELRNNNWWSGQTNALGGSPGLTWTNSDGRTVTAYTNDGGQTYTHGYGPQV